MHFHEMFPRISFKILMTDELLKCIFAIADNLKPNFKAILGTFYRIFCKSMGSKIAATYLQ